MGKLMFSALITSLLFSSCGTTKQSAAIIADTSLKVRNRIDAPLPYQDEDRTRGSVSPGAEEGNATVSERDYNADTLVNINKKTR
jgi:hypothetical protein